MCDKWNFVQIINEESFWLQIVINTPVNHRKKWLRDLRLAEFVTFRCKYMMRMVKT